MSSDGGMIFQAHTWVKVFFCVLSLVRARTKRGYFRVAPEVNPRRALCALPRLMAILVPWLALTVPANAGSGTGPSAPERSSKKLIEFGWDEPDASFLRRHLDTVERAPFDGCVYHIVATDSQEKSENFAWLCWGRRAFTDAELKPALDDLRATPLRRFTHNFLRINTTPADLDWFDDYSSVANNARLAAHVARDAQSAGILLDVEQYQGKLFTYRKQAQAKTRSWADYAGQARRRGREVMEALQDGFPGLTVFLTFGHSLPRTESQGGKKPLADCDYGLLAPFLDGMIAAAQGDTRLVDGFELSYGYQDAARFDAAYQLMKQGVLPIVADPVKYARVVSAGFGLWMDHDWRRKGWDTSDPTRNYFTPAAFEASLKSALERSDQYVWIYTETPRWWSEEGKRVQLPDAYVEAIARARSAQGTR
jgi:hypothetical protein